MDQGGAEGKHCFYGKNNGNAPKKCIQLSNQVAELSNTFMRLLCTNTHLHFKWDWKLRTFISLFLKRGKICVWRVELVQSKKRCTVFLRVPTNFQCSNSGASNIQTHSALNTINEMTQIARSTLLKRGATFCQFCTDIQKNKLYFWLS